MKENSSIQIINSLMVEVFNDILKIEETSLREGNFNDISITEVHTVEAIGMYEKPPAFEVAKKLGVTAGTLSVAINNLVKKGYVERVRSDEDRRIVNLGLTKKGRLLFRLHEKFHSDMVKLAISDLSEEEEKVLASAFKNVHTFLNEKFLQHIQGSKNKLV